MTLSPRRDEETGELVPREPWDPCVAERGAPGWPSLERAGTTRAPRGDVRHGNGSLSFYPRQCIGGRCGGDEQLVTSRGQVLDHVGFSVEGLDAWIEHLRNRDVTILDGPYPFGQGRALLIEGLDGLVLELVEEERPAG